MKQYILGLSITIICFFAFFPVMEHYSQSFKFVDEDEHLVIGYLVNKGWKLYADTSGNHQPLVFLGSAVVQKITHPQNVFMLIKRHREAVFLWAIIWSLTLYTRFGWRAIPAIIVYETYKYFVLGDHFLAESIAAYPFMYLLGSLYDQLMTQKAIEENIIIGAISALSVFLLLPLVIPITLVNCIHFIITKGKKLGSLIVGAAIIIMPLFLIVSPTDYFKETIKNNINYAIPAIAEAQTPVQKLALFSLPITTWAAPRNPINNWISFIAFAWLITLLVFIKNHQTKQVIGWIILYLIWGTSNSRVLAPGKHYFEGFHLLPWLGAGTLLATLMLVSLKETIASHAPQLARILLIVTLFIFPGLLLVSKNSPLFAQIDPQTENYIQHAPMTTIGQIIKLLANPNDRLISLPNETLIYFDTGLTPAMHQVGFNDWQFSVPDRRAEYFSMVNNNPPEFIVFHNEGSRYTPSIENLVNQKYTLLYQVSRGTQGFVRLYIRTDKAESTSSAKWRQVIDLPIDLEPAVENFLLESGKQGQG